MAVPVEPNDLFRLLINGRYYVLPHHHCVRAEKMSYTYLPTIIDAFNMPPSIYILEDHIGKVTTLNEEKLGRPYVKTGS